CLAKPGCSQQNTVSTAHPTILKIFQKSFRIAIDSIDITKYTSVPKRSKDGSKTGKSKVSLPKVVKEDTTSIQLSLFDAVIPQTNESP
ncbi:MAG: hypothetical protein ACRDEA_12270, partial [Microcystaceae cyanobacterium]